MPRPSSSGSRPRPGLGRAAGRPPISLAPHVVPTARPWTGSVPPSRNSRDPRPGGVVLTITSAEVIRGLPPRRYSLISGRCAPIAGGSLVAPSASPRCWLMSASIATTGSPWPARCRTNSDDNVVFPLPPLPTNAIFTGPPSAEPVTRNPPSESLLTARSSLAYWNEYRFRASLSGNCACARQPVPACSCRRARGDRLAQTRARRHAAAPGTGRLLTHRHPG